MTGFSLRTLRIVETVRRRRDVATRRLEQAYGVMSARYFRAFWQDAAHAIGGEVEKLDNVILKIRKGDRWTFVQRHWVMLDDSLSRKIVAQKSLMYEIGANYGWRAPRHLSFDLYDLHLARRFMDEAVGSVVVKPAASSRGNGITTRIERFNDLRTASVKAAGYGRRLIVEEFVEGDNYRLLFLDGEMIAAVRREPPSVIGDGTHCIRELVRLENETRLKAEPATSLIPLTIDLECKLTLRRQGLTESSIPARDQKIRIKSVINQNASRDNHTVSGGIHPSIIDLGRKVGSYLNLKLFGMDLITRDIGVPLTDSGGVIVEINTPPGLHYHDLVSHETGKVPIGRIVLESMFTVSDKRWCG